MGKFIEEASSGRSVVVTTGGLPPTGTRLRLADGKFSVTDGPFIEAKELTGGFAVIQVNSLEEAIEQCKRFRQIVGDGESEIVRSPGRATLAPPEKTHARPRRRERGTVKAQDSFWDTIQLCKLTPFGSAANAIQAPDLHHPWIDLVLACLGELAR